MGKPVIIIGAGGLGRVALDIFKSNGVLVYGFLDEEENLHGTEVQDISVLGSFEDEGFLKLIGQKCDAFVALEDVEKRLEVVRILQDRRKVMPINAIHQTSVIEESASISHGDLINSGVTIGSESLIGSFCIFNSQVVIDYRVTIEDCAHIGAGSIISPNARIGKNALIGSGAIIAAGIKIEQNAKIGTGSVVVSDVKKGKTVFGNPAQVV